MADEPNLREAWEWDEVLDATANEQAVRLDNDYQLAAVEPGILPHTLVVLQALLGSLPTSWKKHSLLSLSRQVRKLLSEANPRIRERVQLARLATWSKEETQGGPLLENKGTELVVASGSMSKYWSF